MQSPTSRHKWSTHLCRKGGKDDKNNAEERCPSVFRGMGQRLHWPFEEPAAFVGSAEDELNKFREVRDQIERRIQEWLSEQDNGWLA